MLAEVLTIGDELCRGEIVDTNSAWLAAALWDLDIVTGHLSSCRDIDEDIETALSLASERADVVLVSGGLGPTVDDLTVDVVSKLVGADPVSDPEARERLETRAARTGWRASNLYRQVRVPEGARVHPNTVGLAPGFEVEIGNALVFCFPGVPGELKAIFQGSVEARLAVLREGQAQPPVRLAKRVYRVFGRGESQIADMVDGVVGDLPGASLHFQVVPPEILVKIVFRAESQVQADDSLAGIDTEVRKRLGHYLYGVDDDSLSAAVGRILRRAKATVATAESCTGGLVGAELTNVPGSSDYFVGSVVAYQNREKVKRLGVSPATLHAHGAVSEATVIEMAGGVRKRLGVTYGVAVSGVAGPGGGTDDKPIGTVWLAVAGPSDTVTRKLSWPGTRGQIRTLSAFSALSMVMTMATKDALEGANGHGRD